MSSIFDLKTSASQLPSINQGLAELEYQQVDSTAPASGDSFPSSTKRYRFDVSDSTWWIPSRSYLRIRAQYYGAGGANKPLLVDDIAPNMGTCGNLFQTLQFDINNKPVSKIEDNVAQIDALLTRMNQSKSWIDSIGKESNYWQPTFEKRQQQIVADAPINLNDPESYVAANLVGYPGSNLANDSKIEWTDVGAATFTINATVTNTWLRVGDIIKFPDDATGVGVKGLAAKVTSTAADGTFTFSTIDSGTITALAAVTLNSADVGGAGGILPQLFRSTKGYSQVEFIWRPPLSIFQIPNALPAGQYQLSLTPQTADRYKKAAIESYVSSTQNAPTDFDFKIVDMYLYVCTVKSDRVDNITYYMSLDEVNCQPVAVDAGATSQKKQFDVVPSTYRLTCAFQDQTVVTDTTKSASKFKYYGPTTQVETDLRELYIQYAGQTRPSPYGDPQLTTSLTANVLNVDYLNQRYIESALYSGLYYNIGGAETKEEWIARGPYYTFQWPKDGTSESTRVYVNYKFGVDPTAGVANLLLFSHYKQVVAVTISNGRVSSVQQQLG